ncbi:type IV secretory system conjugative DNA transfer family protein [Halococcus salifodinae]|uniref:DUF8128 domain-containing protein n=1 Tax=Halococcus salifodinae DSM 8989 TaxID=1227456 RepID=M0NCG0_9EURY|nr:type IV secretory system conjugative DNA transfer family protein [Halococcus salifodinae]EMA54789.1 hypothetical protein C450_04983 [Halococcus salifodinae DSM 8989]
MGLTSFLSGDSEPSVIEADDTLATDLYDRSRDARLQTVRPYKNTENGLERGMKLLTALHDPDTGMFGMRNKSESLAFELHYGAETELLQSRVATKSEERFELVDRQVQSHYGDSDTREVDPAFLEVQPGQYVSGTTLQLRQRDEFERLRPIRNFRLDPDHFEIGPFRSIAREMVGAAHRPDCDVLVQSVIKPAVSTAKWDRNNWWYGIDQTIDSVTGKDGGSSMNWGEVGKAITEPIQQAAMTEKQRSREERSRRREREENGNRFTGGSGEEPTASRSDVAQLLDQQRGMRGYHLCIRIIAVSDDREEAQKRVQDTAGMFRNFYDSRFQQGFVPVNPSGKKLHRMLQHAASREYTDRKMTFPVDTLTGVCKIPTDLALQQFDHSMSAAGQGVPPRTPRFDWDEAGLDRATASLTERQRALLSTTDPTQPYWYGYGMRSEVEAGVKPDILNVHQFVGGSTGVGKTTLLTNFFYQVMQRGHGGLFFDPKGQDAKDIVRLLPDHREDDLVFIDIGADAEYEVGFNFLEIPLEDPDPESQAFDSAVSALADDFEALLAQSGDGSSWGARMSGITRAVVRGLAEYQVRTDETVTMLDMAFLLADEEGRQRIHEMMGEERIEWIQQATHVIAEYSQDDLEPLFRRLWEWIFSSTIRSVASHPSTTISIDDIVREGKIVVVRNSSGADTPKRLITTALLRRLWVSIREQTNRDDHPDPPQFYVVCDEFDKVVSEKSNIHNILREARAFGLSLTFAAQNLDTGGGDDVGIPESIQKAIRGNCKTFLTFDPGDPEDAKDIAHQHSKSIDGEDIEELSKFRIYMRTHDDQDDKTDSYKVQTLPPAPESLSDGKVRSDAETNTLIAESQERYGQPVRSNSDIKDEMLIDATGGTGTIDADAALPDELDMEDKRVRNRALKVIYDESVRQGDPGGFVAVEDCLGRLRRYLPGGEEINSVGQAWREVFQEISDAYLADRENVIEEGEDAQTEVKALDTGFMNIGHKENDGGKEHWEQMADAYVPFTQLGFVFDIPEQTGGAMPDGLAKLDDALYLDDLDVDDHDRVATRVNNYRDEHAVLDRLAGTQDAFIESEHSTGQTQPSQTISNLAQAHNEGHRCLFICRPGDAEAIYDTVAGEEPCYRDGHSIEGEQRFYTFTNSLSIDGQQITRPGASDNVWVYDEQTGQYILRDNDGTEHARFNTAADIFTDASAYPSGGDRTIKPPAIPEYEFDGGDPNAVEWDIITVPESERDEDGEKIPLSSADLELYRPDEENQPLSEMILQVCHGDGSDEQAVEPSSPADTAGKEPTVSDGGSDTAEVANTDKTDGVSQNETNEEETQGSHDDPEADNISRLS